MKTGIAKPEEAAVTRQWAVDTSPRQPTRGPSLGNGNIVGSDDLYRGYVHSKDINWIGVSCEAPLTLKDYQLVYYEVLNVEYIYN
jgi:hypothetical protein